MSSRSEGKDEGDNSNFIPAWANIQFSELELGERIGGGGVGLIYKGYWKNEPVAVKTLFDSRISADLKKEYMDELLVMSKVNHSNIVKFMGACMVPPNLCFVMELCECSLFQILHVDKIQLTRSQSFQAAIDVASAVEYLHSLSPAIIHRDLKSHNILKSFDGYYKICDFGLVHNRNIGAGTPAYMAPELLENKSFSKSVDSYALGVVLWELFSAEIPFSRYDIAEIRNRVLSGKRPIIPSYGFSPRLARLIERAWSQNPLDRPTITEIVDELLELEKEMPTNRNVENMKDSVGDILDGLMTHK